MKINRVLVTLFLGCNALSGFKAFASTSEARYDTRESVNLLRIIPARATLAQVRKVLPRNMIYGWDGSARMGDWTWHVRHFRGVRHGAKLEGVLVFANNRAKWARLRPARSEKERDAVIKAATAWRATDILHSATVFLGDERKNDTPAVIERESRRQINRIGALLGRPLRKHYETPGSGPGDQGWIAEWKSSRGRSFYGAESLALLDSEIRPSLELMFPYSQIYQA